MNQTAEDDFRGWVSVNRDRVRRTAYLLSGDWFLSDDLVQEALARAFMVWPRVTSRGAPDAYVRKIVVNLYLDHRRRPARREDPQDALPETAGRADFAADTAERDRILNALATIPPGQRAVLVLRYWEDLSIEQAAQVLGRSSGHVKSQSSRGLAALRSALDSADYSPAAESEGT